jgi:hypothetical protein
MNHHATLEVGKTQKSIFTLQKILSAEIQAQSSSWSLTSFSMVVEVALAEILENKLNEPFLIFKNNLQKMNFLILFNFILRVQWSRKMVMLSAPIKSSSNSVDKGGLEVLSFAQSTPFL